MMAQERLDGKYMMAQKEPVSVEIRWAGCPTVYRIVRASTYDGASKAAMRAGAQAAVETKRGKPDTILLSYKPSVLTHKCQHIVRAS
jgi:hypothetical protein